MAIVMRRGAWADFDPAKMLPGEWAIVLSGCPYTADGRAIYHCLAAGVVRRLVTYEELLNELQNAFEELEETFTEDVVAATTAANTAAQAAIKAKSDAEIATASANEAADDAREAAEEARGAVSPDMRLYLSWVTDEDGDEILAVIDASK